jgi:hypothetical protein
MHVDLDTFLVGVYTLVDDLYTAHLAPQKPCRPGQRPVVSDSEILTLLLCQQWIGTSERRFLRYVHSYWRAYFPRQLTQSAFNRRARDLAGALVHLTPLVAQTVTAEPVRFEVVDGIPVPLARLCRGKYHRLFADEAAIGKGGADRHWYYGCKLFVAAREDGVVTGFVLGPASTEERWLGEALWCWRTDPQRVPWGVDEAPASHNAGGHVGPTGPIWPPDGAGQAVTTDYLADRGLSGRQWVTHWARDYQAAVVTPRAYDPVTEPVPTTTHASYRQVIETVNDQLTQTLHLPYPGARTRWGLLTRVAAKLAALNIGIWLNRHLGRPSFALATLFPG